MHLRILALLTPLLLTACATTQSDDGAICAGTQGDRRALAAALVADGGAQSRRAGLTLLDRMAAGCG